jgi:serine/threonine protein kinase
LQYLYDRGFEGHGDLKPSNLLYDDLRHKFQLKEKVTWPSTLHPWRIRVADLGWTDAWVDLGFSNKALRNYMAPERLDRTVVRIKSDMFSMGVIASELLQGHHPAENLKKALESEGKWKKWVENGERNLRQIQSTRLQRIIERCLDPNPDSRPDSLEFLDELCAELSSTHCLDVAKTLGLWRSGASGGDLVAQHDHEAWAAVQSPRLGAAETQASLQQISKKMEQVNVIDFEGCEAWARLAEAFVHLTAGTPEEQDRIRKLASDQSRHDTWSA